MKKQKAKPIGVVYSTNDSFGYQYEQEQQATTLPINQQQLYVQLDRKQRAGKQVTLVSGFVGTQEDLSDLAKELKTKCGVGGSCKDSQIIIQGDFAQKIIDILCSKGYKTKRKGG
jgi:translation initiation factor 1